ncbi:MAG: glycine cleavage system protein T [Crocinitomicaceae bacterium]|nr:glycine cleavage system protein T [Crocinitomicaceae bacterium]
MKKTALFKKHQELGAKMVPFAGYEMPVQYKGVNIEHQTVRDHVGMFDVSHMGEFILSGPNALDLIQKVSSNDAAKLFPGRAQYAYLPNENGGVVDDLIIYMIEEEKYMLVVNASNIEKDWNWISKHNDNAEMKNISDDMSLLAIQGPKAISLLQELTNENLNEISFYHFKTMNFAGLDDIIVSATGYTGSGGFELYVPNASAAEVWDKIMEIGPKYGLEPIGLAARDTLRLEMGYCLYGNDIDESTSPIQAGLGWVTKFTKSFINDDDIKLEKENGVSRKLIGFELLERGIPRKGYNIIDENGNTIGVVTSGTMGPSVKKSIGLGYVEADLAKPGSKIYLSIRNKSISAEVVKLPFYKR